MRPEGMKAQILLGPLVVNDIPIEGNQIARDVVLLGMERYRSEMGLDEQFELVESCESSSLPGLSLSLVFPRSDYA